MTEEKSDPIKNVEYRPVIQAEDFFENNIGKEKLGLEEHFSMGSFFSFILNRLQSDLLRFIKKIIGAQLYISVDDLSPKISPEVKKIINSFFQKKLIKKIIKISRTYPDEPEIIQYRVEIPSAFPNISLYSDGRGTSTISGGADLNEEKALMKAVGEGLERFCLSVYREKKLLLSSYNKIVKKALNPLSFAGISSVQRKLNQKLKIEEESIFRWVKGFSLSNNKEIFIPAQLVYIGYRHHPKEPIIQQQLSTGAAAAESFEEALYRGICEAVERDAFIITYLNKLSPPLIEPEIVEDENFQHFLAMFRRYNLELYLIDMTTDIAIPSVMAMIIDRTEVGQAVHVATKTSLDMKEAIRGVIFEAIRGRISFRGISFSDRSSAERRKILKSDHSQIKTFVDRCLFWSPAEMINEIKFLFQGSKKEIDESIFNKHKNLASGEKLKTVKEILQKVGIDIYWSDVTMPQIKKEGIHVVKAVSPQLQPLYLEEELKCLGGERLYNVPVKLGYRNKPFSREELNLIPHPFL